MSLALVVAVQLIVVGFEEGGVLVSRGFVVDVLYGIQPLADFTIFWKAAFCFKSASFP